MRATYRSILRSSGPPANAGRLVSRSLRSLVFSAFPMVRFVTPSWSAVCEIGHVGRDREVAGQAAKTSTGVSSAGLKSSSESPKSRRVGRQKSVKIADAVPPIKWATAAALEVGNRTGPRSPCWRSAATFRIARGCGIGGLYLFDRTLELATMWHTAFGG